MDDLVEYVVAVPDRELLLLAPRDSDALLSEEAFKKEEFLPYWAELWPSSVALARVVARRPLKGRRTIELGCGLGLPAIVAAAAGGRVLATDWSPDAVAITARNAERNGVALETGLFRWDAAPERLGAPWPLVLASDVLYEVRNVDPLLELLPRLTDTAGEVWLADPGRPPGARFFERAAERWRIDAIPHDGPEHVTVHRLRRNSDSQVRLPRSTNALRRASDLAASRSAVCATNTRPAIRPRNPPGFVYSLR
jgi:predicted nicotinamide N-methyase